MSKKSFFPRVEQEYTVGPAGFRVLCPRKPGAILETGSLHPPPAALRLFPFLGFPAHTFYPQGVCGIRRAAQPLTAALPYRHGNFITSSTNRRAIRRVFFYFKPLPHEPGHAALKKAHDTAGAPTPPARAPLCSESLVFQNTIILHVSQP